MRKVLVLIVASVFVFCAGTSFAGGIDKPGCGYSKPKCSAAAGSGPGSVFQKASKNISTWDNTAPEAKTMSLRGNKCELKKRRKADNYMIF